MLKNRKSRVILSVILMLLPAATALVLNLVFKKGMSLSAVLTVSGIFLVMQLLMEVIEKKNIASQNAKVMRLLFFMLPALNLFICALGIISMSGTEFPLFRYVGIFFGALLILFGNYLPKCKRNRTMGIKLKWTLENDENWRATHRFAGILWCIIGALVCVCTFLPEKLYIAVFVAMILLVGVIPTVYSYFYYRRQRREGTYVSSSTDMVSISPKAKKITAVLTALILVIVAVLIFTGEVTVTLAETSLTAKATFWTTSEISYEDISYIEYLSNVGSDVREFGVGSPRLLVGRFRNEEIGTYIRYTYTQCNSAVLIVTDDGSVYMLGLESENETASLYSELESRIAKEASK